MPTVEIDGQLLYYQDTGRGIDDDNGPVLLFSHGLFMDHTMFAPQIEALRSHYRCIAWDERGHGRTPDVAAAFSYYDSAADAVGLLKALGIEQAVFIGMSQGGFLSLRAALVYPQYVRALVLIDSQAGTEESDRVSSHTHQAELWQQHGLFDRMADGMEARILGAGYTDGDIWKAKWQQFTADNVRHLFHALDHRDDISDRLGEIDAPALVIHGEQDIAIPMARAEALAQGLPQSTLLRIAGAGHAANLSHPAEVTSAIERFLATIK